MRNAKQRNRMTLEESANLYPEWIRRFDSLIHHDLSDFGSLIPIWIIPKERILKKVDPCGVGK